MEPPPAPTPARVAAAATAAGCARMANLRAALSAALRAALTSTDFEVSGKKGACVKRERGGGRRRDAARRARARIVFPSPTRPSSLQDFRACFPDFPEDVCVALHDLYRQVLHSTRAHAEVGRKERGGMKENNGTVSSFSSPANHPLSFSLSAG